MVGRDAVMLKSVGTTAGAILKSQTVTLLGWGLLVVVASVGSAVIYLQHGRLQRQGDELAALRRELDPLRASSREPEKLVDRSRKSEADILREVGEETS